MLLDLALTVVEKDKPPGVNIVACFHLSSHTFYFVKDGWWEMLKVDTTTMS